MYNYLETEVCHDSSHHNVWPFDQYYISEYVYQNKEKFIIFNVEVMNTPVGNVLRHNWAKDVRMYNDLNKLIENGKNFESVDNLNFNVNDNIDSTVFPNVNNEGYNYFKI